MRPPCHCTLLHVGAYLHMDLIMRAFPTNQGCPECTQQNTMILPRKTHPMSESLIYDMAQLPAALANKPSTPPFPSTKRNLDRSPRGSFTHATDWNEIKNEKPL